MLQDLFLRRREDFHERLEWEDVHTRLDWRASLRVNHENLCLGGREDVHAPLECGQAITLRPREDVHASRGREDVHAPCEQEDVHAPR